MCGYYGQYVETEVIQATHLKLGTQMDLRLAMGDSVKRNIQVYSELN